MWSENDKRSILPKGQENRSDKKIKIDLKIEHIDPILKDQAIHQNGDAHKQSYRQ